jgi:hypothetical protein
MQTNNLFIAHPTNAEQINALKAFMQALKIKFEISTTEDYNPDFVNKIIESKKQAKNGKVTRVTKDNLKEFLGL